jgi:hypothetical protein
MKYYTTKMKYCIKNERKEERYSYKREIWKYVICYNDENVGSSQKNINEKYYHSEKDNIFGVYVKDFKRLSKFSWF